MCSSRGVPDFQLNIWRYSTQLPLVFLVKKRGLTLRLDRYQVTWIVFIVILLAAFQVCYFRSTALLPLGTQNACFQTTLLVTITLAARLCFGERLGSLKLVALVVTLIGILLVTQPQSPAFHNNVSLTNPKTEPYLQRAGICKNCSTPSVKDSDNSTSHIITSSYQYTTPVKNVEENNSQGGMTTSVGYILAAASGSLESAIFLLFRHRCYGIDPMVQTVWFSLSIMFLSFPVAIYFETIKLNYTTQEVAYLLGHSFSSTLQIVSMLYAVQHVCAVIVSLIYGMSIVFGFSLQYTVLKGIFPGHGNWIEVLGAAITLAGIVMASVTELIQESVNMAI